MCHGQSVGILYPAYIANFKVVTCHLLSPVVGFNVSTFTFSIEVATATGSRTLPIPKHNPTLVVALK